MAITKMSNSGIATGGSTKYNDMLAGNPAFFPSVYTSIASVTAAGGETSFAFTSIPQSYKHLQLRYSGRLDPSGNMTLRFNGNNPSNYYMYGAGGYGSTVNYESIQGTSFYISGTGQGANVTYATVGLFDIYDYSTTGRNKSFKNFLGKAGNATTNSEVWWTGGFVNLDTNALSSIQILGSNGFVAGSVFSLYGMSV